LFLLSLIYGIVLFQAAPVAGLVPTPTPIPQGDVTITGRVTNAKTGVGIGGARVSIDSCHPRSFSTQSAVNGSYSLFLPTSYNCGDLPISYTAAGYRPYSILDVRSYLAAHGTVINVVLHPLLWPVITSMNAGAVKLLAQFNKATVRPMPWFSEDQGLAIVDATPRFDKPIRRLDVPGGVKTDAFSSDGKLMAVATSDSTVQIVNVADFQIKMTFQASGSVARMTFSPDSSLLASAEDKQTVQIWDIQSGKLKKNLKTAQRLLTDLAFSPDNALLVTGGSGIQVWDLASGKVTAILGKATDVVSSLAYSLDGGLLATGGTQLQLWDMPIGQLRATLDTNNRTVHGLAFSPSGVLLAAAVIGSPSAADGIQLWDAPNAQLKATLTVAKVGATAVSFDSDETLLVSGSPDGTVCLWVLPN
jgi:WD40 repeat protein